MSKGPRAFRLDELPPDRERRAIELSPGLVVEPEPEEAIAEEEAGVSRPPRRWRPPWLGMLLSALGGLLLLALGLGVERLVRDLMESYPALGWLALGLAVLALAGLLGIVAREGLGMLRERRIEGLQKEAARVLVEKDEAGARRLVAEVAALYARRPETARARGRLADLGDAVIDAPELVGLAERELLAPLDRRARRLVAEAAQQVSVVTALSPRAIVDVAFVLYSAMRLMRRIAALYGGRPGTLGFLRLAGNVLSHLTLTSGIAMGDSLLQQVMGLGLAARVSAKLGEGVVNGLLTARVGLSAIAVCRPLPFTVLDPPVLGDVASSLFDRSAAKPPETP